MFARNASSATLKGQGRPIHARATTNRVAARWTARNQRWRVHRQPKIIPAIEWLANVMMKPETADDWPVFRIDNPELIALLKLPEKDEPRHQDGKHYAWNQIQPSLDAMDRESKRIGEREARKETAAAQRTPYERAVMKMHERLVLYMRLKNTLQPQDAGDWAKELGEFESSVSPGVAAVRAQRAGQKYDEAAFAMALIAPVRDGPIVGPIWCARAQREDGPVRFQ